MLQLYEEGRLGYIDGATNPYPPLGAQRMESAAWELGWLDARRAGAGHLDTTQRIRGDQIE